MKEKINLIVSLVALIAAIIVLYNFFTGRSFTLPFAVMALGDAFLLGSSLTDKTKEK